ncbi:DUF2911 domain-containing protein [Gilvibacter sediminis]|uniref:DUF2911 domain-containing protein n=1 Tax=Gilvibacter sediminis TaxID=379071 RepID=UPI0023509560|nr:DUF2911 domain-containing protein [Gilvibacter sediminis]MDC7997682.1 DUF2911 domain-containing protein [Gilvibacter sediminis]
MKLKSILKGLAFSLLFVAAGNLNAQDFKGLDKSPMDVASYPDNYRDANKLVKVQYSRPQLKGRSLAKLAPNGEVWRTGANECAEITFYVDMTLNGKKIPAGTYSLFTIPGDNEWTVIINSDLNAWGAYFYKQEKDVARAKAAATMASDSLEEFSMLFTEGDGGVDLHMGWDKVRVTVPFKKA